VSAASGNAEKVIEPLKGMQPSIQSFNSVKEVKYPWGWIRWMMNSEMDPGAEQTFGIVQINAGQRNPLHKHPNCEELLYVLSGSFENVMDGKTVVMHAGDIVRIPRNTPHQGINNTKEPMRAIISYSSGTRQMVALGAQTE
jgi:quercetin dioxygenase-like cupin family protein